MASEPAEPTTRQQCEREGLTPIPDHGVLLIDCTVHGPVGVIVAGDDEYGRAEAAFAKHLLADPAQTTELERLRAQVALLGRHLQSSADKDKRIIAWRVEAEQAHQNWEAARAANMTALETIAELRTERDERQARIDAALRTCDAAELIAKIGSMEDPDRWKVALATVTDVRAALNGELPARAALAGDQPTADDASETEVPDA